jgi:prepilin-type processing-associated H-X9-DG protein
MNLTLLASTKFSMPPEPAAWKHAIAMGVLALAGIVAVGKMTFDCVRPTLNSAATSFGLAVGFLIVCGVVTPLLQLDAPIESNSANSRATTAIVVVVLWLTNLGVAVFSSSTLNRGKRTAIAVIGILLAGCFLMTATLKLAGARIVARRTECKITAKAIGIGLLQMAKDNGEFPAAVLFKDDVPRSWRVELLPWLDQKALRDRYRDERSWDDADSNAAVARTECRFYQCPCSPLKRDERGFALSDYAAVIGPQSVWSGKNRQAFPEVADGSTSTLLLVESAGLKIPWSEPRDADTQRLKSGVNLDGAARGESEGVASGYHSGGCYAAFADGSVRFLSKNMDPQVLSGLMTSDGGEQVTEDF